MATYYQRNKEAILAQHKEYRAKNREKFLEYFRTYYVTTLKPLRNLQRVNNASRWNTKPVASTARPRLGVLRPIKEKPPGPIARCRKVVRPPPPAPGPIVSLLPGRVIDWSI